MSEETPTTVLHRDGDDAASITSSPNNVVVAFQASRDASTEDNLQQLTKDLHAELPHHDSNQSTLSLPQQELTESWISLAWRRFLFFLFLGVAPAVCFRGAITSDSPFLPLTLVQFVSTMLSFFWMAFSDISYSRDSPSPVLAASKMSKTARYYGRDPLLRTVHLKDVHLFRVATDYEVLTYETTVLGFTRITHNEDVHFCVEAVNMGDRLLFCRSRSRRLAEDVANLLNSTLQSWRETEGHNSFGSPQYLLSSLDYFSAARRILDNQLPLQSDEAYKTSRSTVTRFPGQAFSLSRPKNRADFIMGASIVLLVIWIACLLSYGGYNSTTGYGVGYGPVTVDSYRTSWVSTERSFFLSLIVNRFTAVVCIGVYTLWAYTLLNIGRRREQVTLDRLEHGNGPISMLVKLLVFMVTGRSSMNARDIRGVSLSRGKTHTFESCFRSKISNLDCLGGRRYMLGLHSRTGRSVYEIDGITEGEALFIADKIL